MKYSVTLARLSDVLRYTCVAIVAACSSTALRKDAPNAQRLLVIIGQSNADGLALVSTLTDASYVEPYPDVPYQTTEGDDEVGQEIGMVSYPWSPLGPRTFLGSDYMGIELSLGRALDDAEPGRWSIVKYAIGGTSLCEDWDPVGAWPSASANLYTTHAAALKTAIAEIGIAPSAVIWIQGEADSMASAPPGAAADYGANLAAFIATERSIVGDAPFFVGRLNALYVTNGSGTPDVRAGEEWNARDDVVVIDQDPYPLQANYVHYTADGYVGLGYAYAAAILAWLTEHPAR